MEVQNGKEEPATLEEGLDFWIKQERKFQSLFGQEALKDREFLKMKLRHYDRLWYKYKNASLDTEGQLMRNMLKFQRRKIDKSMHRGFLRQIFRRINTAVESKRAQKVQRKIENKNQMGLYNENSPRPEMHAQTKKAVIQQRKEVQQEPKLTKTEQAMQQPESTKRDQTKSYSYNHTPRYKHKQRRSRGVHH